jgi:hypothetical protein
MGIHMGRGTPVEANSAPDGGRWWQMLGLGAIIRPHTKAQAIATLLTHRNVEEAARAVTTPKQRPTVAHFAKPARIPWRETCGKSKNHTENRPKNP